MALTVADTFSQLRTILNKPFLRNEPGVAWQATLGQLQDESFDRVVQANTQRMPSFASLDGLQYLASERELERAIGESENNYREVLRTAWNIWAIAGTAQSHISALGRMGCGSVTIKRRADFSFIAPDPNIYVTAFARDVWAQFDIILQKPMPWGIRVWGSPPVWGVGLWGSTMTSAQHDQLIRLLRQFRSGHDTPTYLWMHFGSGKLWGIGVWGVGVWGGTGPIQRLLVGEQQWYQRGLAT